MTRGVFNWTYSDAVKFLKSHGFSYSHAEGSHHFYTGWHNGSPRIVQVPFHGSKSFKPRTFKGIVIQSGIPLKVWLEE